MWRHHPFLTNSDEPTAAADITHRRHAIIETVFADLIDGPLAHLPSGRFAANSAWAICAAMSHNLLRAAGTLAGPRLAAARGATLRRKIVNLPARIARPQRRPSAPPTRALALGRTPGWRCGTTSSPRRPAHPRSPDPSTRRKGTTGRTHVEKLGRPAPPPRPAAGLPSITTSSPAEHGRSIGSQGRGAIAGPFPHPPFNPCVRFSRTRLTDGVLDMVTQPSGSERCR